MEADDENGCGGWLVVCLLIDSFEKRLVSVDWPTAATSEQLVGPCLGSPKFQVHQNTFDSHESLELCSHIMYKCVCKVSQ